MPVVVEVAATSSTRRDATFSSRAGAKIAVPYQEAVDRMKGVTDPDDLNENQERDKLFLEKHRTQQCALCRVTKNKQQEKKYAELRAHIKRMKDECIGKKCAICRKKFLEGDQPIIEFDHRIPETKLFHVSSGYESLGRALDLGGVHALELERAKCNRVHYHCHRQRTFLQSMGLDGHAIPVD